MPEWIAPGAEIVTALIALWALVRTMRTDQHKAELEPIKQRLDHLDDCLDAQREATKDFREKVFPKFVGDIFEELRSMSRQMTGMQVASAERFVTKPDLRDQVVDLRAEINLAGRVASIDTKVSQIGR